MVPYGILWFPMVPNGSQWFPMAYGSLWFPMVSYGSLWFPMVPHGSLNSLTVQCIAMFHHELTVPPRLWGRSEDNLSKMSDLFHTRFPGLVCTATWQNSEDTPVVDKNPMVSYRLID